MLNSTETVTAGAGASLAGRTADLPAANQWKGIALKLFLGAAVFASAIALPLYGPDAGFNAYDIYRALVFVHVTAALVAFGSTFAIPVLQPLAARGGVVTLRMALKFSESLERLIIAPGSLVVIASGVGLMFSDMTGYRHDPPLWLLIAIGWVVVVLALAIGVNGPATRRAIVMLEATPGDGPLPPALGSITRRVTIVGQVMSLSVIAVLFLMVWKPNF